MSELRDPIASDLGGVFGGQVPRGRLVAGTCTMVTDHEVRRCRDGRCGS